MIVNKKKVNITILYFIVIAVLILLTFRQLPQTFYQQDEWLGSGQVMAIGYEVVTKDLSLTKIIFADGRPLARLLGVIFFKTFSFNTVPLAIYSIVFHTMNSFLVFLIALKLLKNNLSAFIGASFFALNSVSHQTVTWFAASFGTQPAVFLSLLSIYFYLLFLEKKRKNFMYMAFLGALLSLYFKEIGIFLFIFLPLVGLLFGKRSSLIQSIRIHAPFVAFVSVFAVYRLIEMLLRGGPAKAKVFLTTSAETNIILDLALRTILYPLTSFSLIYIPYPIASILTLGLTKSYYPYIPKTIINRWDLVSYTAILDLIAVLISCILLLFLYFIYKKRKELRKVIIFSFLFFFLSIIPYVVVSKEYSYLEPRYYYFTMFASGLILAVVLDSLSLFLKRRKVVIILVLFLFLGYLHYHTKIIRKDIAYQVIIAAERKNFLSTLNNYLPTLTSNTNVFYFTGSKSWLVDGNKTPFQHGFGYSVMAIYYKTGKVPAELLVSGDEFLFALGEQGFKSIDGKRFGYFNDLDDLKDAVNKNSLNLRDIHSFYYNWEEKMLYDISGKIRENLRTKSL